MRLSAKTIGRRFRRFWASESGTSDVEFLLIAALVVFPLCVVLPYLLTTSFTQFYRRATFWLNLPFP